MSDRPKRNAAAPIVIALLVGVMALARFANSVRSVAVAGLFAGGMAFGAGMMRLILQWRGQLAGQSELVSDDRGGTMSTSRLARSRRWCLHDAPHGGMRRRRVWRADSRRAAFDTPASAGNPITGQGLPNPAPNVTRNWGQLPAGRSWGTTAGIDIDPIDGNVWAYERCGAGAGGGAGGGPVDCETNAVDPIFKFDRNTGAVLANFGKGVMVTPHGISVDKDGNVWVADFSGNKAGTKGHQVHKFSPKGEKLLSLGTAGKPGNADGQFNQPNDVVVGPDGSIYVADGHDAQGMTTARRLRRPQRTARRAASASSRPTASSSSRGGRLASVTASSARRMRSRSTRRAACGWPIVATTAWRSSIRTVTTSSRAICSAAPAGSSSKAKRSM